MPSLQRLEDDAKLIAYDDEHYDKTYWKLDIQAIVEYKMFDVGGVELGGGVGTSSRGWR